MPEAFKHEVAQTTDDSDVLSLPVLTSLSLEEQQARSLQSLKQLFSNQPGDAAAPNALVGPRLFQQENMRPPSNVLPSLLLEEGPSQSSKPVTAEELSKRIDECLRERMPKLEKKQSFREELLLPFKLLAEFQQAQEAYRNRVRIAPEHKETPEPNEPDNAAGKASYWFKRLQNYSSEWFTSELSPSELQQVTGKAWSPREQEIATGLLNQYDRIVRWSDNWGADTELKASDLEVYFKLQEYNDKFENRMRTNAPELNEQEIEIVRELQQKLVYHNMKDFSEIVEKLETEPEKAKRVLAAFAKEISGTEVTAVAKDSSVTFYQTGWEGDNYGRHYLSFDTNGNTHSCCATALFGKASSLFGKASAAVARTLASKAER